MFQTEYEFTLPKGFVDADGNLHREGIMRLSTAGDEILPLKDPRVKSNEAYLIIILLSRVVTKLGTIDQVTPKTIEGLFAEDLGFLQNFYNQVNTSGSDQVDAACPKCEHSFEVSLNGVGG